MLIQYRGFDSSVNSRIYNFNVIDPPHESREFTVQVPWDEFRPGRLKFQDGPGISSERLQRELKVETTEVLARTDLHVSEQDVRDFRTDHYPAPKPRDRR